MPFLQGVAPLLALVFLGATLVLLVGDLKRPERFWYLLAKPNPTSWLVWGGWILQLYGALLVVWLAANLFGWMGLASALLWPGVALAVGSAGYTAFLFGQAEGRDFWQSPLLLPHLIVQAALAGAAVLALVGLAIGFPRRRKCSSRRRYCWRYSRTRPSSAASCSCRTPTRRCGARRM